ncbi:amino acid ABC transporter permease [Actinotignum sp. GS-2025c]|uniref:amino acid ABC transporter permease n=1 Tax=Actinotignum sp. GS-2025c TaxID=3427276 RepID=UPI003F45EF2E
MDFPRHPAPRAAIHRLFRATEGWHHAIGLARRDHHFSLNTGAYISEGIRGAQLSIPSGQWEAASTLRLTHWQTLRHVIGPQIWRIALPSISNEFVNLVKSTSLASVITISDVFQIGQQITARVYEPLVLYVEVAAIYLAICTLLTWLQAYLEKKTSKYVVKND